MTDLQSKYSKLAQEYSKLRAQNQVLKKAVVDEQSSCNSLKDELKQKEQSLRRVEQEMDSLSFRNQQLMKRVELLQEELLLSESKSKKSRSKGDSPSQVSLQAQSVFDEDLHKKIQENERLHIQWLEAQEQHQQQEAQLSSRLQQLQEEAQEHQAQLEELSCRHAHTIHTLQEDKATLEVKLQTLEREARDCRVRTEECQQQLRKYQSEVSSQLKHSSSVIQEKVPFNDTQLSDYNSLNVPAHNRRHQLRAREVAAQALVFLQNLVSALLNFHSYSEQRVQIYPRDSSIETISAVNQKFSQYLHENASYLRQLEEDLLQLHQSITEDLPAATQKFCTTNECLLSSLASLTSSSGKMATFFSNSLDFLTSCAGYSPSGALLKPLQADSVMQSKRRAAAYISSVRQARAESVPYGEALANRHILTSSTESREGLMQQVLQSQQKISRLEQEKEHWLLEAQLAQVRLQKESARIAQLEAQVCVSAPQSQLCASAAESPVCVSAAESQVCVSAAETPSEPALADAPEPLQDTSVVGVLSIRSCSESSADQDSREQLIKTHYMSRVSELTTQLQICDSKAVHFHAECRAVAKRLAMAERSRDTLGEELKLANQNITRLQDELSTTKRSYEDQLSMMSDHLCSMNETLSQQRETIDTLKLSAKGNAKKNKSR
ncbi:protein phosphatase 1 regulatory subunit 21 [Danio rerio]|uniref:Protein phosphatase 1 regulatory subunit 21 n=1 Tax=Danio rerio TaxID=7955 RepID=PPR21_DANRE|nr:protein phosphatase 1 regulatory subunit 21 [Danio rerio]Q5U3A8.1 RecName: Full=Protein phosphatase 1 regulatory subunit 21; AltName: Full=Coiled-coil domain-containing protein 128; AltName: Full=KLRAQ motif-containing protein 1 [Danio rerio]AAH85632.1 Zgc:92087 [Danio rerio]|eukprot:NP_001007300.1 protein phosphatase 1 regulatory subunit 21 [Danio rerio]